MNHTDRVVHWVLSSLELETTLFHLGQYCGTWRASVAGRLRAGFHVVLHGECWLHLPGAAAPARLQPGDAVFFLRDVPHHLGPHAEPQACLADSAMLPLDVDIPPAQSATGLACGFFDFRPGLSEALLAPFPDYLVLRARDGEGDGDLAGTHALFGLIVAEARRGGSEPSPLIARLVDLLFFYVVRHLAARDDVAKGLWPLLRSAEFSGLMLALIRHPERTWTVEAMAALAHMSRATFCKRFAEASGQSPAAFLLLLRMKVAEQLLGGRCSIAQAAERVGYRSEAAFARAFKKATGVQPGAMRRQGQRLSLS
ncbi:cupin domain-containing protein [Cupriavidus sp. 30B13]|uniref:AraC family transcriptional regulator n=1 Tax=Cupriavidus sp. 30B13 TaxID=3384241 RepID=UPI003B91D35E